MRKQSAQAAEKEHIYGASLDADDDQQEEHRE